MGAELFKCSTHKCEIAQSRKWRKKDYKETTLYFAFAYGACMYMYCNLFVIHRKREKEKETRVLLNTEKIYDSNSWPRKVRNYRIA